jgi:hypothetical protein
MATPAKIPVAPIPAIDDLLVRLRDLKKTIKNAEEQRVGKNLDGVECTLADLMREWGIQNASVTVNGIKITGTLVEGTNLRIDEERLKRALGAARWQQITSRVLDKAKLEDAIARNLVDANVVAQCSGEQPRRPYVTIAERFVKERGR